MLENPLTVFLVSRKEEGVPTKEVGVDEDQSRGRKVYRRTGRASPVGTAKKGHFKNNYQSLLQKKARMGCTLHQILKGDALLCSVETSTES